MYCRWDCRRVSISRSNIRLWKKVNRKLHARQSVRRKNGVVYCFSVLPILRAQIFARKSLKKIRIYFFRLEKCSELLLFGIQCVERGSVTHSAVWWYSAALTFESAAWGVAFTRFWCWRILSPPLLDPGLVYIFF